MSKYRRFIPWVGLCCAVAIIVIAISAQNRHERIRLNTCYGTIEITEPVLIDLLRSKAVQRLKDIHQYGVIKYATPTEEYSRYDHSIGVLALLHVYGASLPEQMAGLLHDTSHTAFSHVGDFVYDHHSASSSYQDNIHDWYLRSSDIGEILEKHGYAVSDVYVKEKGYTALEQELPSLCADRIEYNLQGGLRRGLLSRQDFDAILADLHYDRPHWYFTNPENAKKLARVSLNMTENVWGAGWNLLIYTWAAEAIRQAMNIKLISADDFHFSTDDLIWHKLMVSGDPIISTSLDRIRDFEKLFRYTSDHDADMVLHGKFRGVDPFVTTDHGLKRLTAVDAEYRHEFDSVKAVMDRGWAIKLVVPTDENEVLEESLAFEEALTAL